MATRRAEARVDLSAIRDNCARLAGDLRDGAALCVVVKADGYGHGAAPAARAALAGGASRLAVATAGEAADLRAAGVDAPVLVMGALTRAELDVALEAGARRPAPGGGGGGAGPPARAGGGGRPHPPPRRA